MRAIAFYTLKYTTLNAMHWCIDSSLLLLRLMNVSIILFIRKWQVTHFISRCSNARTLVYFWCTNLFMATTPTHISLIATHNQVGNGILLHDRATDGQNRLIYEFIQFVDSLWVLSKYDGNRIGMGQKQRNRKYIWNLHTFFQISAQMMIEI